MERVGILVTLATAAFVAAASAPAAAIVGAQNAAPGEYPSVALVSFVNAFISFECTGTLIAPTWVLTAGHCGSATGLIGDSPVQWPAPLIRVQIGGDTRDDGEAVPVAQAYGHPSQNLGIDYDISLLRLSRPSTHTPTPVIGAGDDAAWSPGTLETIVGWGVTEEGGESPDRLQEARVPVTTDAYCADAYGSSFDAATMVCAGYPEGGTDTCQGDSGGPMFGTANGAPRVVGTTSWGQGCAQPGHPGVYARVGDEALRGWIRSLAADGVD